MKLYGTEIRLLSPKCLNFFSRIREREAENAAVRLVCFVSEAKEMAAHSDLTRTPAVSGWFFRYFPSNPGSSEKFRGIVLLFIRITTPVGKQFNFLLDLLKLYKIKRGATCTGKVNKFQKLL